MMRCVVMAAMMLAVCVHAAHAEPAQQKAAQKPEIVSAEQWGSKPQPIPDERQHTPKYITIHHAGVDWTAKTAPEQFVRNMQGWGQREKNWPDLPYHFLIAPDGRIFEGRPLKYEPESNTKYLLQGNIGVEMMGNFETQRPTQAQLQSCVDLVAWLAQDLRIEMENVRGHKDAAPQQTSCPGRDFQRYLEDGQFMSWVKRAMHGEKVKVEPGPPLENGPKEMVPVAAETEQKK
jgi:hypothetical protein